ncbi:MAG: arsenite methyltransferase [Myxococcota bacterium]|jgi:SAM-dependent methyltransferase|nr:arsenite methyltransferase [Myxococcota bacterium]
MNKANEIRNNVSSNYANAVEQTRKAGCCSAPAPGTVLTTLAGYKPEKLLSLPPDAVQSSFGCGNPVALADIREGDTVLDLGAGAGIDLLLAAQRCGPKGKVIGVDMTPAMLERARANAAAAGFENIELRQGIIEALPIESDSIDLLISNCVINLSPEKDKVFSEILRVLRPGGRFSISDIVAEPMPEWIREDQLLYSACIAGAIPEQDYLEGLHQAGLTEVQVSERLSYDAQQLSGLLDSTAGGACCCGPTPLPSEQVERISAALAGRVASVRVTGSKPKPLQKSI